MTQTKSAVTCNNLDLIYYGVRSDERHAQNTITTTVDNVSYNMQHGGLIDQRRREYPSTDVEEALWEIEG